MPGHLVPGNLLRSQSILSLLLLASACEDNDSVGTGVSGWIIGLIVGIILIVVLIKAMRIR